ncbi:hypothetical protein [Tolypothrix sp. VBCCA 56010]|uniref:hypothetical protein n=1 Tax=Tolypothrix sp. VBCCA 56010 TaxID=3137731 RepID=UPI003D7E2FA4
MGKGEWGSGGVGDKETRRQKDKENSKFNTLPLSSPSQELSPSPHSPFPFPQAQALIRQALLGC